MDEMALEAALDAAFEHMRANGFGPDATGMMSAAITAYLEASGIQKDAEHLREAFCKVQGAYAAMDYLPASLPAPEFCVHLNVRHKHHGEAAHAFWKYWKENGETHKHGYYESTWGAINAAISMVGVVETPKGQQ